MAATITRTQVIETNGIRLHVEEAGPEDGPLVVLLHGFPENWAGWLEQIGPLSSAGFRVLAPDQRGYNLSDKPAGVDAYRMEALTADILGLLDALGRAKAVIVGHDWGGVVAWALAARYPQRVARLVILNAPHPAAMKRAMADLSTGQALRSWYMGYFQIPRLPEILFSLGQYAPLRRSLARSARDGAFSQALLSRYTEAWSRPGALTAMINWYRANVRQTLAGKNREAAAANEKIAVPTLILWGEQDAFEVPQLAAWSQGCCEQAEVVRFPAATHWVQHEEAGSVNSRMIAFLKDLL